MDSRFPLADVSWRLRPYLTIRQPDSKTGPGGSPAGPPRCTPARIIDNRHGEKKNDSCPHRGSAVRFIQPDDVRWNRRSLARNAVECRIGRYVVATARFDSLG